MYLGSSLLRTVSLYSSTTQYRRVIAVTVFPTLRSGTVTLKVSTSGHTVIIDGLGVSRS